MPAQFADLLDVSLKLVCLGSTAEYKNSFISFSLWSQTIFYLPSFLLQLSYVHGCSLSLVSQALSLRYRMQALQSRLPGSFHWNILHYWWSVLIVSHQAAPKLSPQSNAEKASADTREEERRQIRREGISWSTCQFESLFLTYEVVKIKKNHYRDLTSNMACLAPVPCTKWSHGFLRHFWVPILHYRLLQYADDTRLYIAVLPK